jgi:hypothetical protein
MDRAHHARNRREPACDVDDSRVCVVSPFYVWTLRSTRRQTEDRGVVRNPRSNPPRFWAVLERSAADSPACSPLEQRYRRAGDRPHAVGIGALLGQGRKDRASHDQRESRTITTSPAFREAIKFRPAVFPSVVARTKKGQAHTSCPRSKLPSAISAGQLAFAVW